MNKQWPTSVDYQDALQNPDVCLRDVALRGARPADLTAWGLPLPLSGQFANVYRLSLADGTTVALRVWLADDPNRGRRYAAIQKHLAGLPDGWPAFLTPFRFLEKGMWVNGAFYPVQVMDWVSGGVPLTDAIEKHLYDAACLRHLAQTWREVMRGMGAARLVHGDIQHGNVLVVDSASGEAAALRLVDYDALWTPALGTDAAAASETGHPAYQHPRGVNNPSARLWADRFPALVVYVSLLILAQAPPLWFRLHTDDHLLFRAEDFANPQTSPAFRLVRESLWKSGELLRLVRVLEDACSAAPSEVPDLDSIAT